jgi:hypothetical protein
VTKISKKSPIKDHIEKLVKEGARLRLIAERAKKKKTAVAVAA